MKKSEITETKYSSWKIGGLANGCKECVIGRKLVLFTTGICPRNCFYCPLSEQKKNKDVIFANERKLESEDDVDSMIEEARSNKAHGAGFTGGDPLTRTERTSRYIRELKKEFGKDFHVHLYTIPESFRPERLKALEDAGLDELRFHPDLESDRHWGRSGILYDKDGNRRYSFDIGIEIPLIPGYEENTKRLIDYFIKRIDFLNLNELEISDTNSAGLLDKGFKIRGNGSYAVAGSREMGLRVLRYISEKYPGSNVHLCTCKLKDGVQLRQRLKLRAQNTKKIFDIVTDDGTIIRGAIYIPGLEPSFSYKTLISNVLQPEREGILRRLDSKRKLLLEAFSIPESMIEIDEKKLRLVTNIGVVKKLSKQLKSEGLVPAIVEQYPTWDQMEVDVEFL